MNNEAKTVAVAGVRRRVEHPCDNMPAMRSERIPFVTRFVRVTGKGRPLQGGGSFFMRFRSKGFSLSFLAWEKSFFFAPFIPLSRGLWYTGAQGAGCKQAAGTAPAGDKRPT